MTKMFYIKAFKIVLSLSIFAFVALVLSYIYFGKPWQRALFLKPLYKLDSSEKVIALTFDDGPTLERTPPLLDLLDKYNIKVSFFLVGQNIEKYPEITKDIVNRGHLVGNHSYSHKRMILKTPWFINAEIEKTNQLLKDAGSKDWQYFRPPNTKKLFLLPLMLKQKNMILVTGSLDPESQYQTPFPKDKVVEEVLENIESGDIVYLHDGRDDSAAEFVTAVEEIIIELQKQGYKFVTIDGK